jgi:hypothetical protein
MLEKESSSEELSEVFPGKLRRASHKALINFYNCSTTERTLQMP